MPLLWSIITAIVGFFASATIIGRFGWMGSPTVLILALIWVGVAVWAYRRRTRSAETPSTSA